MQPLEELRQLEAAIAAAADLNQLRPIFYRLEEIARQHAEEPEVGPRCSLLREQLFRRANLLRAGESGVAAGTAAVPGAAPLGHQTAAGPQGPIPPVSPSSPAAAPATVSAPSATPVRPPTASLPKPVNWRLTAALGGLVGLALFGVAVWVIQKHSSRTTPAAEEIALRIESDPPGASLMVDGAPVGKAPLEIRLRRGAHQLTASLDGYETLEQTIEAGPDLEPSLVLRLRAHRQQLMFIADLSSGTLKLNGTPAGNLLDGQLFVPDAAPGAYKASLEGAEGSLSFDFEIVTGQMPRVTSPVRARNGLGVLLAVSEGSARLYASQQGLPVKEGDRPLGVTAEGGIDLAGITSGGHTLTLGEGNGAKTIVLSAGGSPKLLAFLKRDLETGSLVVLTNVDDATVYLNGRAMSRKTRGGQLRIPFLPARTYRVKVAREGFAEALEQTAEVRRGEETKVSFALKPVPATAWLVARGLPEGTEVWVGEQLAGKADASGEVRTAVEPGRHMLEFRKEGYENRRLEREFARANEVVISGAELGLKALAARVILVRWPSGSEIRFRRETESAFQPVRENEMSLPAGAYVFVASAPDYQQRTETVRLRPGETRKLDLSLQAVQKAAPVAEGLEGLEDFAQWRQGTDWTVRQGGAVSLYRTRPFRGTVVFTAARRRGKELRWVADYRDNRNHLLFVMDDRQFRAVDVRDGRNIELARANHGLANTAYFTVSMEVIPEFVAIRVFENNAWRNLHSFEFKGRNPTEGRFGFSIGRNEEIGVRNFSFTPSGR